MRLFRFGVGVGVVAGAVFFACVGDEPDAGARDTGTGDGGGGGTDSTTGSGDSAVDSGGGGSDAGGDAVVARCDPKKAFGDPQPISWSINDGGVNENGFSMTSDELIAVVQRDYDLYLTSRMTTAEPFPAPTVAKIVTVTTGASEVSPVLSGDGKNLYFVRDGVIMLAQRKDLAESFDAPIEVKIDDAGSQGTAALAVNRLASQIVFVLEDDLTYVADRSGGNPATFIAKRTFGDLLEYPLLSADEKTFYLVAAGDAGSRVMRYVTRANPQDNFGIQVDMPANLRDYEPLHVTDDHCIMYVRARTDAGTYDIWEARKPL